MNTYLLRKFSEERQGENESRWIEVYSHTCPKYFHLGRKGGGDKLMSDQSQFLNFLILKI